MKQLLIVKSDTALNATGATPKDLSVLVEGAITFYELDALTALAAEPTKNFAIALGRKSGPAFLIPEVDINTLKTTKALPSAGTAFSATFTFPTATVGKDYTVILVKRGTVPHERNTWSFTYTATTTTAATGANAIKTMIEASLGDKFTVSVSAAAVTITAKTVGEQWGIQFGDSLYGTTTTSLTEAADAIGDKKYIENLASMCAAGKGFTDTYRDGDTTLPGYPETVENLYYVVYTLRFAVGRDSVKTRDERVSQLVHIAVPRTAIGTANAIEATLDKILAQPVLPNAPVTNS